MPKKQWIPTGRTITTSTDESPASAVGEAAVAADGGGAAHAAHVKELHCTQRDSTYFQSEGSGGSCAASLAYLLGEAFAGHGVCWVLRLVGEAFGGRGVCRLTGCVRDDLSHVWVVSHQSMEILNPGPTTAQRSNK